MLKVLKKIFPIKEYDFKSFCFPLLLIVYILGFVGVYLIYVLDYYEKQAIKQNLYSKQILAFAIGIGLILVVALIDYHIIAPDIITFKGIHQNPYKMKGVTKGEEIKLRNRKKLSILFYSLPFLYKLKSHEVVNREGPFIDKRIEDVVPHGAAVIFMNKWVEREEFAFYPGTFMYYEEDLLYVYAKSKDYKTIYVPSLQITHLEDMSTNSTQKNIRKKMLFQNKQKAHSLDVIINYMKGQE